jgi:DNA helicase-2/ATP-dependent DNA helicase PcrA
VKTILDYLRVINQPDNNDALARIINTPSRRIGEATIKSLLEEADKARITLWSLILGVVQGNRNTKTKLPSQTDQGLSNSEEQNVWIQQGIEKYPRPDKICSQ